MGDRSILLVHAHPDDESIYNGAAICRYAETGAKVVLVTCTRGEEGAVQECCDERLRNLVSSREDRLGEERSAELAQACSILGLRDSDHFFLGDASQLSFRDSGMMGWRQNDNPTSFWQAGIDAAAAHLVEVIRTVRPNVLITYDSNGQYGHPDHIRTNQVAMRAAVLAADPAFGSGDSWDISKIYWNAVPTKVLEEGIEKLRSSGAQIDPFFLTFHLPYSVSMDKITTVIDGRAYAHKKVAAMKAHRTQIDANGPYIQIGDVIGDSFWGMEYYVLVKGALNEIDSDVRENSFFEDD